MVCGDYRELTGRTHKRKAKAKNLTRTNLLPQYPIHFARRSKLGHFLIASPSLGSTWSESQLHHKVRLGTPGSLDHLVGRFRELQLLLQLLRVEQGSDETNDVKKIYIVIFSWSAKKPEVEAYRMYSTTLVTITVNSVPIHKYPHEEEMYSFSSELVLPRSPPLELSVDARVSLAPW